MNTISLPMYDFAEVQGAIDSLWNGIVDYCEREGIRDLPRRVEHGVSVHDLWSNNQLLFSQCCGYDIVNRYKDRLCPIAVPHFDVRGCDGNRYASVVMVAEDAPYQDVLDMYGTVAAINGPESHSGMNALRHLGSAEKSWRPLFHRSQNQR